MAVATHLIVGYLGVGKTTALLRLLSRRPAGETWAVIVNEFGQIGLDGALLEGQSTGIPVREVAGGCLCCQAGVSMRQTVTQLLRELRPRRLFIEPSGLGHPAGLMDMLSDEYLRPHIELKAVIGLVDPRYLARLSEVPLLHDQAQLADVLLASKSDLASAQDLERFHHWCQGFFPPKAACGAIRDGDIDPTLLDLPTLARHDALADLLRDQTHVPPPPPPAPAPARGGWMARWLGSRSPAPPAPAPALPPLVRATFEPQGPDPDPRRPLRRENSNATHHSAGWIFSTAAQFQERPLVALLGQLAERGLRPVRMKGIFRVAPLERRIQVDQVDDCFRVKDFANYRRESRLELIVPQGGPPPDWGALEAALLATLAVPPRGKDPAP
ncbi:MAG: GTP-binding protein [Magnetococcus sp. WYHC-3]